MIVELEHLVPRLEQERRNNKVIVTTNGCFDVLHVGHVRYLHEARKLGDILVVGVNGDRSPYFKTKPGRPLNPEQDRMEVVAALSSVSFAFLYDDENPISWVERLRPQIHVKCTDATYTLKDCVERGAVERCGGNVVLLPKVEGRSTTDIVSKILTVYGQSYRALLT